MSIWKNEKIRTILLMLVLAVSFLILDGGIQYARQNSYFTGNNGKIVEGAEQVAETTDPSMRTNQGDPRGTLQVQYEELLKKENNLQEELDSVNVEKKLIRARMEVRGVKSEEEL